MQLCFCRSGAPTSDLSRVVIRLSRSQKSHSGVLCSCNVGARQTGIYRGSSRATHHPSDFLSAGQMECTTPQMWGLFVAFCLTGVCSTAYQSKEIFPSRFLRPGWVWAVVSLWCSSRLFRYLGVCFWFPFRIMTENKQCDSLKSPGLCQR